MIFRGKGGGIQSLHKVKKGRRHRKLTANYLPGGVIMRLLEGLIRGGGSGKFYHGPIKILRPLPRDK